MMSGSTHAVLEAPPLSLSSDAQWLLSYDGIDTLVQVAVLRNLTEAAASESLGVVLGLECLRQVSVKRGRLESLNCT
jgi:hypothetical protein